MKIITKSDIFFLFILFIIPAPSYSVDLISGVYCDREVADAAFSAALASSSGCGAEYFGEIGSFLSVAELLSGCWRGRVLQNTCSGGYSLFAYPSYRRASDCASEHLTFCPEDRRPRGYTLPMPDGDVIDQRFVFCEDSTDSDISSAISEWKAYEESSRYTDGRSMVSCKQVSGIERDCVSTFRLHCWYSDHPSSCVSYDGGDGDSDVCGGWNIYFDRRKCVDGCPDSYESLCGRCNEDTPSDRDDYESRIKLVADPPGRGIVRGVNNGLISPSDNALDASLQLTITTSGLVFEHSASPLCSFGSWRVSGGCTSHYVAMGADTTRVIVDSINPGQTCVVTGRFRDDAEECPT